MIPELIERGTWKAVLRLAKQFGSFSPFFEIFSTQIYTHSIISNLTFGGARYIATGRGFATARLNFSILFSRFAGPSIYLGIRTLIMLLYVSLSLWTPYLIYFWLSITALCLAPFMFNPHQFVISDFLVDYRFVFIPLLMAMTYRLVCREFLRWMSRGNSRSHANSWIGYCRLSRTTITGYKKKKLGHPSEKLSGDVPRATWRAVLFSEILWPVIMAGIMIIAYMFVKSFPDPSGKYPANPLIRIAVISLGPIVWNAAILLALFIVSLFFGPILDTNFPKFGSAIAFIAHGLGLVGMLGFFEFLVSLCHSGGVCTILSLFQWFLELWDTSHAVLGLITVIAIQRAIHKVMVSVFLTREFKHDETNRAWWTGKWYGRGLGAHVMSQPAREFIVKIIELSLWSSDILLGHLLLFLLTLPMMIPYFDRIHATCLCKFLLARLENCIDIDLVWLRPSQQIRAPVYFSKQKKQRRWIVRVLTLPPCIF
jgi:1,3-beta-glucan synthase